MGRSERVSILESTGTTLQRVLEWVMSDDEFSSLVDATIDTVPQEFLEKLENVSVTTQAWPTRNQLTKAKIRGGLLLGLYEGIPRAKGGSYRVKLPDKITLFKNPILIVARTRERVTEQVRSTLIHEIAHHFGMNEHEVRQAEDVRNSKA